MIDRRTLIKGAGALATALAPMQALADMVNLPFGNGMESCDRSPALSLIKSGGL